MRYLDIILVVGLTWFILDITFYSPKSQIKRLWKEIFKYSSEIAKWKDLHPTPVSMYEEKIKKVGILINAILDYHYKGTDDEEDKEYVKENRWEKSE